MAKTPTNLSVDPAVMERSKIYGQRHGTSVSQLVGDFLSNLPDDEEHTDFTVAVNMLYGIATDTAKVSKRGDPIEAYHRHLESKYGAK